MLRALGEVLGPDDRVLVIDDNSPDGTGELADRLAAELGRASTSSTGRARRASAPPTSPASGGRSSRGAELVLEMDCDFSHDPADVPRLLAAAGDADLVLGSRYVPGGGVANWGAVRRAISRGRLALRAAPARRARARPDRRLQVLPPRGARADRPGRDPLAAATPSRSRRPTARCARGFRVARSRSGSSTARSAARRCRARSCSRRSGRCRCSGSPRSGGRCERGHRRDLRGRRAPGRRRHVVDFWAPWCKPCKAIEPILEALAAEHGTRPRAAEHRRALGVPSRYGVLSLPTVILFEDGEPRSTVVGARPRSHFERAFADWLPHRALTPWAAEHPVMALDDPRARYWRRPTPRLSESATLRMIAPAAQACAKCASMSST